MEETEWEGRKEGGREEVGREGGRREGKRERVRKFKKGKGVECLTYLRSNETETNETRHRGWKTIETTML